MGGLNYQPGICFLDIVFPQSKEGNSIVLNLAFTFKIYLSENINYWDIWCFLNISQSGIPYGWVSYTNEEVSCQKGYLSEEEKITWSWGFIKRFELIDWNGEENEQN